MMGHLKILPRVNMDQLTTPFLAPNLAIGLNHLACLLYKCEWCNHTALALAIRGILPGNCMFHKSAFQEKCTFFDATLFYTLAPHSTRLNTAHSQCTFLFHFFISLNLITVLFCFLVCLAHFHSYFSLKVVSFSPGLSLYAY